MRKKEDLNFYLSKCWIKTAKIDGRQFLERDEGGTGMMQPGRCCNLEVWPFRAGINMFAFKQQHSVSSLELLAGVCFSLDRAKVAVCPCCQSEVLSSTLNTRYETDIDRLILPSIREWKKEMLSSFFAFVFIGILFLCFVFPAYAGHIADSQSQRHILYGLSIQTSALSDTTLKHICQIWHKLFFWFVFFFFFLTGS